jgi:hypothetical protein
LEKFLIEYEQCHCNKLNKEVTVTSMVFNESNSEAVPGGNIKQAFDCNQKEQCGVLTILGNERLFDWTGCTHPGLLTGRGSVN